MKMFFIGLIVFAAWFASTAQAQTSISVDINKAKLAWDWVQGAPPNDGMASEFHVKCGQATGVYTKVTVLVGSTIRQANVKDIIAGQGNWFCVVTAANTFGESGASNEVPFVAGAIALPPTNARVVAQ